MKRPMIILLLLVLLVSVTGVAHAQSGGDFDLTWSTVDGGGRFSAGGSYSLGGSAGQPDAGVVSGGAFELSGGFWNIKTQDPAAVRVVTYIAESPVASGIAAVALLAVFIAVQWSKKPRQASG